MPVTDASLPEEECPIKSELDAYKEATRIMLGFRTREEMEDIFKRKLVWRAMTRLEDALAHTRSRGQPEEFALALAIEQEVLGQTGGRGQDLQKLFNDPNHHEMPSQQVTDLIVGMWNNERT